MTISWDHPSPAGVVFVLALAYRQIVGHVTTESGPQPVYATSQWTSITETTDKNLDIDLWTPPDAIALMAICARSAEGRLDEECPL